MHFILRAFLALALCAMVLPSAAQLNPGLDASTPIRVVYRVDTVHPLTAFITGFTTRGMNEDLLALTSGVPCNPQNPSPGPGWVVMTADRGQAVRFAQQVLEQLQATGANRRVYLFAIRADADFISVPGAFYSAIDAGRANRAPYTPELANALEYLLYTRPILGDQFVVASRNFINATSLWIEGGEVVENGSPTTNAGYIHDPSTAATTDVPDGRLPALLPPYAIASSEAAATGTCAMSCDRATSASSFSLDGEIDYATQCSRSDAMTPLLFDIING